MGVLKSFGLLTCGNQMVKNEQGQSVASPFLSGRYIPAHVKNGQYYSACWRGSFFVNDGNTKAGENGTVIQASVWNGRNSQPGMGAADQFAKTVSVGQMLMMDLEFRPYNRKLFNPDGTPIYRNDGSQITVVTAGWRYISGSRRKVIDSQKTIDQEIQRGQQYAATNQPIPAADFFARTDTRFTNPNHQQAFQDYLAMVDARRKIPYTSGQTYGYALVEIPNGVELALNGCPTGIQMAGSATATANNETAITTPATVPPINVMGASTTTAATPVQPPQTVTYEYAGSGATTAGMPARNTI